MDINKFYDFCKLYKVYLKKKVGLYGYGSHTAIFEEKNVPFCLESVGQF